MVEACVPTTKIPVAWAMIFLSGILLLLQLFLYYAGHLLS